MKQQVCLITPHSMVLLDERVSMSLGILRAAAVLEQQGYGVETLRRNRAPPRLKGQGANVGRAPP
jgi:hypothetical protein